MWSVVGMQGSLLFSLGLRPVKFNQVIVGNVMGTYGDISMIKEDCIRAFGGRLQNAGLKGEHYYVKHGLLFIIQTRGIPTYNT